MDAASDRLTRPSRVGFLDGCSRDCIAVQTAAEGERLEARAVCFLLGTVAGRSEEHESSATAVSHMARFGRQVSRSLRRGSELAAPSATRIACIRHILECPGGWLHS